MTKPRKKERSILLSCLLAQVWWIASAAVLLLILCAVISPLDDPDKVVKPLCMAALYISALIGGIAAVRISGDGIASGALSGVFTAIIVMMLAFVPFPESGFDALTSVLCALLVIPASVLGSILGHRKSPKKSFPAKMRRK